MKKRNFIILASLLFCASSLHSTVYSDSVEESAVNTTAAKEEIASAPVESPAVEEAATVPATKPEPAPAPEAPLKSADVSAPEKAPLNKVVIGGGAYFLDRNNYRLIQPQTQSQTIPRMGDPNEFDTHGLGSFGDVMVERVINDDFSVAAGFLGATLENDDYRPLPGGTDQGVGGQIKNASIIPLLNPLGAATLSAGLGGTIGSGIEVGGKPRDLNAKADSYFSYETQQFDVNVDVIRNKIYTCKDLQVDGILGWGFTHVNQDFELATRGINVNNAGVVTTKTVEGLQDNLFGGRVGMRAHKPLFGKLDMLCKLIAGFYNDTADYTGNQSFHNASFAGFPEAYDFNVYQDLSANRFVPRLDSQTALIYPLSSNLLLAASYRFNVMWNLSNIDHPTLVFDASNGIDKIDHTVRIGTETVTQHYVELKLGLKF